MKLFTINNDEEGMTLVKQLRKQFRNTPNSIRLRGRGYRYGKRRLWNSLPLGLSERVAVYLVEKPKTEWVKVVDLTQTGGYRYVQQPTKWHPNFGK